MRKTIDVSVVTPSLNMLEYLKRCSASIADQQNVSYEHIIVDAVSTDGTVDWIKSNNKIISIIEKDKGMYDAINKGFSLARGNILAYLNCDEQYLSGTLNYVVKFFKQNPHIDVIFGDALIVNTDGDLLAFRKAYQPRWFYILSSHLYIMSCTLFFRRKIFDNGFLFDSILKDIGDQDFIIRLLKNGFKFHHYKKYLSAFTLSSSNMMLGSNAFKERREAYNSAPKWIKILKYPLNMARLMEKAFNGSYLQKMPIEYSIYGKSNAKERRLYVVNRTSFKWPKV